jgi:hypothetical protein
MYIMKKILLVLTIAFGLTVVSAPYFEAQAQTTTKSKVIKSRKKKYALIGAGAGAVTGALVSKNHLAGGVIGGAVGAAGGYLLARHRDKRHPQVKRVYKTTHTY